MKNNWYVLTGGPSSGKTTLITELKKRGYIVAEEMATEYIKEQLAKGITIQEMLQDTATFQKNILLKQLTLEKKLSPDDVVILDRGMHDHYGYLAVHGVDRTVLSDLEAELANGYYKKIFIVDLLPFKPDDARMESEKNGNELATKIEEAIVRSYTERELDIVRVPVMSVEDRINFLVKHIDNE